MDPQAKMKGSTLKGRTYILMLFFYLKSFENYLSDLNNHRCIRMLIYSALFYYFIISLGVGVFGMHPLLFPVPFISNHSKTTIIYRFALLARSPSNGCGRSAIPFQSRLIRLVELVGDVASSRWHR